MTHWPPRWEDCFALRPGRAAIEAHSQRVRSELKSLASNFSKFTDEQQSSLTHVVGTLDWYASAAAKSLRKSPWSVTQLRSWSPPSSAKDDRQIRLWRRYQADQLCVDACARTRQAIFAGDWITAVEFAMVAGNRAVGDLANIAIRTLQPLELETWRAGRIQKTARRNDAIKRRGQEIRAQKPKLSITDIAKQIARERQASDKLLSVQSIRRIIGTKQPVRKGEPAEPSMSANLSPEGRDE